MDADLPLPYLQRRILAMHRRRGPVAIVFAITLIAIVLAVGLSSVGIVLQHRSRSEAMLDLALGVIIPLIIAPVVASAVVRLLGTVSRAYDQLEIVASTDALTSLPNRRRFFAVAERMITERAKGIRLLVVMADLDRFKEINDTRGHAAGDEVLRVIAHRIRGAVPEHGLVGRLGGDEFACVIPVGGLDVESYVTRIRAAVSRVPVLDGETISASVGVAIMDTDSDLDAALAAADADLYRQKASRGSKRAHLRRAV